MTDRRADSPECRQEIDARSHRYAVLSAIQERCAAQGRPLRAVALEAGLSAKEIDAAEAGQADLRLNDMTAICEALGMKTSELIARAEALRRELR